MSDSVFPETGGLFGKSLEKLPYFTKWEMNNFLFKFKTGPNSANNTRAERRTVENFTFDVRTQWNDTYFFVLALSYHSVGNKQVPETKHFKVCIGLKLEDATVVFAECSCKAGKGGLCSHTSSVMTLLCHYKLDGLSEVPKNVSSTSQIQVWHRPRGAVIEPEPIMNVIVKCPKFVKTSKAKRKRTSVGIECNLYEARKENIKIHNIDQIQNLQKELFQVNQTIPFSYQLPSNQEPIIETTFGVVPKGSPLSYQLNGFKKPSFDVNISNIISANNTPMSTNTPSVFPNFPLRQIVFPHFTPNQDELSTDENLIINSISINTSQAVNIERETHMQSESQTWFSERKFRLSASRFGETIYKMTHSRCQPTNFAKKLTEEKNLTSFSQAMMRYGLKSESTAVQMYTKYMHFVGHKVTTYRTGLVVDHRCFWLGASPDRKVFDPQGTPPYGLVEVKCLGKKENQKRHPKELCDEESFYIEQCEEKFLLKKSHMHYKQVQGQIVLAGADWCDFIVYSDVGMIISRVGLDTGFIHNDLQHLNNFYFNHSCFS